MALLGLAACNGSGSGDHHADSGIEVTPLYRTVARVARMDSVQLDSVMARDSLVLAAYMDVVSGEPVDARRLRAWSGSQVVTMFTPPVEQMFPDTTKVTRMIDNVVGKIKKDSLSIHAAYFAEVVWGRPESIIFVDSVMLIALNHYLGANFAGYSHLPAYMRVTKSPEMLEGDIAESLLAMSYPYRPEKEDVLSRILYEGALVWGRMYLSGEKTIENGLGVTPLQAQWLQEHTKEMWNTMVEQGLLFDSSPATLSRLIMPAPFTAVFGAQSPGRAGRYMGLCLVKAYIESAGKKNGAKPGIGELLSPAFYSNPDVLAEISFKP